MKPSKEPIELLSEMDAMYHFRNEARKLDEAAGLMGIYDEKDVLRLIATLDQRQKEQGNPTIVDAYLSATEGKKPRQWQA